MGDRGGLGSRWELGGWRLISLGYVCGTDFVPFQEMVSATSSHSLDVLRKHAVSKQTVVSWASYIRRPWDRWIPQTNLNATNSTIRDHSP